MQIMDDVVITPHAHVRAGGYVIGAGVHIYTYCLWTKKNLNRTLAIDSPFQTYTVGLLIEFTRLALPLRAPETLSSLSKSWVSIFNTYLALFVRKVTSHNPISKYCHLVY